MSGARAIEDAIAASRAAGRPALAAFLTAGFPTREGFGALLRTVAREADVVLVTNRTRRSDLVSRRKAAFAPGIASHDTTRTPSMSSNIASTSGPTLVTGRFSHADPRGTPGIGR